MRLPSYTCVIRLFLFLCAILVAGSTYGQQLYRGIVVDSAKVNNLVDVHVSLQNKGRGVTTNTQGTFLIYAHTTDTLVFSRVGYKSLYLPLLFEEDVLFIMLAENVLLLHEVVIKSKRLYPNTIEDRTKIAPKKMDALDGVLSPFDYFWRGEREKRKLSRIVEETNRTQTFRQVITDPDVKKILMKEYEVPENTYYQLIASFNQKYGVVHYYTDPDEIMEALHDFFEANRQ